MHLLVVEDDDIVRMLIVDVLEELEYQVLEADSAPKAFEILATKPQLDLLVTDFRLPGNVSGVMIAEPALKLRPDLKVIFVSGYAEENVRQDIADNQSVEFLPKPYPPVELAAAVRRSLDDPHSPAAGGARLEPETEPSA